MTQIVNNPRETWNARNNTNNKIVIGDMPQLPSFMPGDVHNLLRYATKEEIQLSQNFINLVKNGIITLTKTTESSSDRILPEKIEIAVNSVEENEILKESETDDIYLRLDGTYPINGDLTVLGVTTSTGRKISKTSVTSSPYTILSSDEHLSVTTASTAITLNLPSIIDGTVYHIKDQDENSEGKNITISPDTGETIENASNLIINTNGASVTIIGNINTNNWEIQ